MLFRQERRHPRRRWSRCEFGVMRSPSIVPGCDVDVYLVLDDFGSIGRAYREVDESEADKASVIRRLIEGQYNIRSVSSPSTRRKAGRAT
jgi:hypothetical protein